MIMTLYWYQNQLTKLPDWTKVFASKIITGKQNYLQAKINIIQNIYQIDLKTTENKGFTEIITENLPIDLLPKATEFELAENLEITTENSFLKTTKYNPEDVDKFLNQEECLFYNFQNDDWCVLKWKLTDSNLIFQSMRTYKDVDITVWSETKYDLE